MTEQPSNSELLSAFLDGELEGEETARLFYALANDADLQLEFRHYVTMRNAIRTPLLSPPDNLRSTIAATADLLPVAAGKNEGGGRAGGWGLGRALMLAVVAMLLSSVAVVLIMSRDDVPAPATLTLPSVSGHVPTTASQAPGFPADARSSAATPGSANGPSVAGRSIGRGAEPPAGSVASPELSSSRQGQAERSAVRVGTAERRDVEVEARNVDGAHAVNREGEGSKEENGTVPTAVSAAELQPVAPLFPDVVPDMVGSVMLLPTAEPPTPSKAVTVIEARRFTTRSYPDLDLPAIADPVLNDMSFGLYRRLGDGHTIGVELGSENVYQEFRHDDSIVTVRYQQNYQAIWVAGAYQYDIDLGEGLSDLHPFARTSIGAIATGPIGRTVVGARYDYGALSLMAGFEGALFLYRYEGAWNSTEKIGITYGVSVHF